MMQATSKHAVLMVLHDDIFLPTKIDDASPKNFERETIQPTLPAPITTSVTEYHMLSNACVIGRDPSCDICVRNHRIDISREHAKIERVGLVFTLYHISKRDHGTFVNGRKIAKSHVLISEDIIGLSKSKEMLQFIYPAHSPQIDISPREIEVLALLAAGRSQKEIAQELSIARYTVNTHIRHIYEKLDAHNNVEAINKARIKRLI